MNDQQSQNVAQPQVVLKQNINPNTPLDPNEPGISLEEKVERQRVFYESRELDKEKKNEENLSKRLDADAEVIRLRDKLNASEQEKRIMQNQYTASFRRGVNVELQGATTPEGKVREIFLDYIKEQADEARGRAKKQKVYMLV